MFNQKQQLYHSCKSLQTPLTKPVDVKHLLNRNKIQLINLSKLIWLKLDHQIRCENILDYGK